MPLAGFLFPSFHSFAARLLRIIHAGGFWSESSQFCCCCDSEPRRNLNSGFIEADDRATKDPPTNPTFCDGIHPACLSELRSILRCAGGSGIARDGIAESDLLEIGPRRTVINVGDFASRKSIRDLRFRSPSQCRTIDGFRDFHSLSRSCIPNSVEMIRLNGFFGCPSLPEVIFERDSHLRQINGFQGCTSLRRIAIPPSVDIVDWYGFLNCIGLTEVIFEPDSHLRQLNGFEGCASMRRIIIPPSVQSVSHDAFSGCVSLRLIEFAGASELRDCSALVGLKCFIRYGEDDLKAIRSRFEINLICKRPLSSGG
jgi:hypothetical protein